MSRNPACIRADEAPRRPDRPRRRSHPDLAGHPCRRPWPMLVAEAGAGKVRTVVKRRRRTRIEGLKRWGAFEMRRG